MKWTETVLVARRRSDGKFFKHTSGPTRWRRSPIDASRYPSGYTLDGDLDLVELTITYEVADGSPTA